MKYLKDPISGEVYAYEADGSQDAFIRPGLVAMTPEDVAAHISPPMSPDGRTSLRRGIDAAVDAAIRVVVGDRISEYQQAEAEATAFASGGYQGTVPASVQAHVDAYQVSAQVAADAILSMAAAWRTVQMQLRAIRLSGKRAILEAVDDEAAALVHAQALADISAAVAPLVE